MDSLTASTTFEYAGFTIDDHELSCSYRVGGYDFVERVQVDGGWASEASQEAARIIFLLAGISYYKAFASQLIDLKQTPVRPGEVEFLYDYYVGGLGEFSYKNNLSLTTLAIKGGIEAASVNHVAHRGQERPLVCFGGGIDSIVSVELIKRSHKNASLFVMSPEDTRFEPLEQAASVSGLPVVRAKRFLDPQILRSNEHGFLNGHVPVTAIVAAVAVAAATANGHTAVVMSNEASSSEGNLAYDGRIINHQYSKSFEFENLFRKLLHQSFGGNPDWFSYLRHRNELWIAEQFSSLTAYHPVFRSCNRAFHIDESKRADTWCGCCEKCAFIDLILSPFMGRESLVEMFAGKEPLENPDQYQTLKSLVVEEPGFNKPFECVGDLEECRQAVKLALSRSDRSGNKNLQRLARLFDTTASQSEQLPHNIPESYATSHILD